MRDRLVAWSQEGLAIYIKRDRKKLGRRKVTYTKVAHDLWDGEMVRPAVIANLGRGFDTALTGNPVGSAALAGGGHTPAAIVNRLPSGNYRTGFPCQAA